MILCITSIGDLAASTLWPNECYRTGSAGDSCVHKGTQKGLKVLG